MCTEIDNCELKRRKLFFPFQILYKYFPSKVYFPTKNSAFSEKLVINILHILPGTAIYLSIFVFSCR